MFIKNFSTLATTALRKDALLIAEAGLQAIQPKVALKKTLTYKQPILTADDQEFNLDDYENIYVAGVGKAAFKTAQYLESLIGPKIKEGAVLDLQSGSLKHIKGYLGTYPFPSAANITATEHIIKILKKATSKDLVITIISGGVSSLLSGSDKRGCINLVLTNQHLQRAGASTTEMNTICKHISAFQGGNIAKLAYPATVLSLILADIADPDLSQVEAGPTFLDTTSIADAKKIAKKHQLPKFEFSETPKDRKYFTKVTNVLMLNNQIALNAMAEQASKLGYSALILSGRFQGNTDLAGAKLLKMLKKKRSVVLAGGYTTVPVRGHGLGGRNQELVLAAVSNLKKDQLLLSIDTDGQDNLTGVAGAMADIKTKENKSKLMHPEIYLSGNNSYLFFEASDNLIKTDLTGSNMADLTIAIQA